MALAKKREDWARTCELLALLYNINSDKKHRTMTASELNPYVDKQVENKEPDFYISPDELDALLTRPQKNKTPPTSSSSLLTPPS